MRKKSIVLTKVQYVHQLVYRVFVLFIVILLLLLVMFIMAEVAGYVSKATRTNVSIY